MDKILKATHQGELDLNGFKISCAVLEDGRRVLVNRSLATALGIKGSGAYWQRKKEGKGAMLPEYISAKYLKPFISEELHVKLTEPISYESSKGVEAEGVEADLLADICDTFVKANEKGALRNNTHIADNAYQMILAFAKVGITALVDEVTGYQYEREQDALQKELKKHISIELLPYQKRFPNKFYMLIFKLKGWEYTLKHIKTGQRPGVVGKWTKKYIYSALPKGVLPTLLNLTDRGSDGRLKTKLFQHLTLEDGIKALEKQIDNIVLLMEVSKDWKDFDRLWNAKYGQKEIPFSEQHLLEPKKKELSDYDKSLKKALDYNPKK
jgi:hypothetical protein